MQHLNNLKAGQAINIEWDKQQRICQLTYQIDALTTLSIERNHNNAYHTKLINAAVESYPVYRQGIVSTSFADTTHHMGLTPNQSQQLVNIFRDQLDFSKQIYPGDRVSVLFSQQTIDGEPTQAGPILAAIIKSKHTSYSAIRYHLPNGQTNYFTPEGKSLTRVFDRFPVVFSYVSSRFSPRRYHPMLHRYRAHEGVDLAAVSGTPVHATSNGKIILRGRDGGYGNAIILKHGARYSTLYAHLSRFAKHLHRGSRVKRGQIIGYVGQTGLATGAHLHYEFRIRGRHFNPLTVSLPRAESIPKKLKQAFSKRVQRYLAEIALFSH